MERDIRDGGHDEHRDHAAHHGENEGQLSEQE